MADDIKNRVEEIIDAAIRSFDPEKPGSYELWDGALRDLEDQLTTSSKEDEDFRLSRLSAQRIVISSEAGNVAFVLAASRRFLDIYRPDNPNFFVVANARVRNLHFSEAHDVEIREIAEIARSPYLGAREFLLLLEGLATRHPGVLKSDAYLYTKLRSAVEQLRSQGYEDLPPTDGLTERQDLERLVLDFANELRRIDHEYTEALLAEEEQ